MADDDNSTTNGSGGERLTSVRMSILLAAAAAVGFVVNIVVHRLDEAMDDQDAMKERDIDIIKNLWYEKGRSDLIAEIITRDVRLVTPPVD